MHEPLGSYRLAGIRMLPIPPLDVIEKLEDAVVVVKRQRPREHLAVRIGRADALRRGPRPTDLSIQITFDAARWVVDHRRLQGDGNKLFIDTANDFRVGEDHLTGGGCEHSAPLVIHGPVDKDPIG